MATIRFLQTTASSTPGFPFQAGQVIHITALTPEMRRWITDGRAELVPEEPELATVGPSERAVLPRGARRG